MKKVFIIFALIVCTTGPVQANVFKDFIGILTDPLKVNRASENAIQAIERAAIHADRIRKDIDADAQRRLEQFNGIIVENRIALRKDMDATLEVFFDRLSNFQLQFILQTADLVRCSTEESSVILRNALSEALNNLGKRKPRLVLFGWVVISAEIEPQDIKSPIESFRELEQLYKERLLNVKETDHPSAITDVYADVARLARLTACNYHKDSTTWLDLYDGYELENIRRQQSWRNRVKPK